MNQDSSAERLKAIMEHSSYRLAYLDQDYITREDLRPLRLELELLKPEMLLEERGIQSTTVVFGGTQVVSQDQADELMAKPKRPWKKTQKPKNPNG